MPPCTMSTILPTHPQACARGSDWHPSLYKCPLYKCLQVYYDTMVWGSHTHACLQSYPPTYRPAPEAFTGTPAYFLAPLSNGSSFSINVTRHSNAQPIFDTTGTRWVCLPCHTGVLVNFKPRVP
jgi:hypothetical protein